MQLSYVYFVHRKLFLFKNIVFPVVYFLVLCHSKEILSKTILIKMNFDESSEKCRCRTKQTNTKSSDFYYEMRNKEQIKTITFEKYI